MSGRAAAQGELLVEPYKGELLPHWRFKADWLGASDGSRSSSEVVFPG